MKWWPSECTGGDMIRVKIGSIYHYGIFISVDEIIQFGLPPRPENQGSPLCTQVCKTDINVFSGGAIVEKAQFGIGEKIKKFPAKEIIKRARMRLGETGYDIIHNNCEHFAYECVFGQKRSLQTEEVKKRWSSRPILDIYLTPIADEKDIRSVYPPERDAEIQACGNSAVKCGKYTVWALLEYAAKRTMDKDIKNCSFKKKSNGKWVCDGFRFSLSHTAGYAAVAISGEDVGVDIESPEKYKKDVSRKVPDLMDKICTEKERAGYDAENLTDFLILWTKKEAIYKCKEPEGFYPKQIESGNYSTKTYRIEGECELFISVCSELLNSANYYFVKNGDLAPLEKQLSEMG